VVRIEDQPRTKFRTKVVFSHRALVASFATFLMLIYLVTVGKQNLPNQSLVAKLKEIEKNEIMNLYIDSVVPLFPSLLFLVFGIRPCMVTHFCSSLIQSPLNFNFPCTVYLSQIADCFNLTLDHGEQYFTLDVIRLPLESFGM